MKQNIITTILLLTVLTCTVAGATDVTAGADTEITSCQVISTPGNYRLTSDIINSTAINCIEITADNVALDGNGHTIDGNGTGKYGIYLFRTSEHDTNITIKNCTVQNWTSSNIYIRNSNDNTLEDIKSLTSHRGIQLRSTKRNNITNVQSNGNSQYGFYLYDTDSAHLVNLSASENGAGLHFSYAAYNWLEDSNFVNNSYMDLDVSTGTDEYWCPNYLNNVTGSGGRPIGYYYDTSNIENLDLSELILCGADNSVISNVTVHGNGAIKNNGINVLLTDNATFSDISSSYNEHGLTFRYSSNNNLTGIVAGHNRWNGLKIQDSSLNRVSDSVFNSNTHHGVYLVEGSPYDDIEGPLYNDLSNITANLNEDYGIYLQGASNNSVFNSVFNSNSQGIQLVQNSFYNNFTNIDASSNTAYGVYLWGTDSSGFLDSNIFDNLNANSNGWYGIYIINASSNTIKNSYIQNNDGYNRYGIYLQGTSLGEYGPNRVYNNLFNNTNNVYLDSASYVNLWNITNTTGPNIIGGPHLGGNYWSNYTGTDDNGDGFGETAYNITGGTNKDYLPLVHVQGLCGDVDGNGFLNIMDVRLLRNHVNNPEGYPVDPWAGDVYGEDGINIVDVQRLLTHVFDPVGHELMCG